MNSREKLIDAINNKFIKRVLLFFRPSKNEFIKMEWIPKNFMYI